MESIKIGDHLRCTKNVVIDIGIKTSKTDIFRIDKITPVQSDFFEMISITKINTNETYELSSYYIIGNFFKISLSEVRKQKLTQIEKVLDKSGR